MNRCTGILLGLWLITAATACQPTKIDAPKLNYYLAQVSADTLEKNLSMLASDAFEGRKTGEKGQKMAAAYLVKNYKNYGIAPAANTTNYLQLVPSDFMNNFRGSRLKDSENVIAYIEGSEKPEEILVISAHYDHMGIENGEIYYGADDNASGTAGILEVARLFQLANQQGLKPKRTIVFAHFTGEEFGLFGSKYYVNHPLFPLEQTIANLNVDMIGRRSDAYLSGPDYIYLVGADRLSQDLHRTSEASNKKHTQLVLDYKYNDKNDPEQIYYRSDHYSFAKNKIPAIFYYNGPHADYHKPTDTADKIDYQLMQKRVQLIFATAWELANATEKPKLDQQN